MTDQKKPLPTFGDVMSGRATAKPGERGDRKTNDREERKPREEKRPGPMVVVKRSGVVVETKGTVTPTANGETEAKTETAPKPVVPTHSVADEVAESESFESMFEKHARDGGVPTRKQLPRVGEKVTAKIFQLGAEVVFATIGKHEAMIDLDELKDAEGILRYGVGDEIEAFVMETGAKGIQLSRKLSKGAASLSMLVDAKHSGLPVDGLVLSVNKGGLEIAVGDVRAFCPSSQVDVRPVKLEDLVGQRLTFRVTEVKEKNVVLSRRALVEEENKGKAIELKKTLEVGKVLKGRIVGVQAFGAFVDLGGLEGLIPVSELSHVRIGHPSEVVEVGNEVEVEVLRMEDAEPGSPDKSKRKDRITLSMRALLEDPFKAMLEIAKEGALLKGKVVRLQPFGAFVELAPGVDGLIHISAMSDRRIAHPKDVLTVGQEIEVKVEKVDENEKRIGLRLVKDGVVVGEGVSSSAGGEETAAASEQPAGATEVKVVRAPKPKRGTVVTGKVTRIETYGIFIEWDGFSGLIPASETGTERGTDLRRMFPMGKQLKAEVVEINGDKLKLSIVQAERSEERADLNAWKADQAKKVTSSGGFNSLADKLKGLTLK
ncbi:MAG: S1 RNA-binding domain-containing protein [Archangium sp.]|nr:S1 RNA-binding domain-containing protein [Archangium sp.]